MNNARVEPTRTGLLQAHRVSYCKPSVSVHSTKERKSQKKGSSSSSPSTKVRHRRTDYYVFKKHNATIMSTAARRRLMRDFKRLQEDPPAGVSGAPGENNIMVWNAVIFGPHDTPFEDGTFKLTMEFSEEYPNKPPVVRFLSKMFHPNIYADGGICLDILQTR